MENDVRMMNQHCLVLSGWPDYPWHTLAKKPKITAQFSPSRF